MAYEKDMKLFRVHGRVVDAQTNAPVSGLKVEAWDEDGKFDDLLAVAVTDARGEFRMTFDRRYFGTRGEYMPDLYFKVFRRKELLADTHEDLVANLKKQRVEIEIPVNLPQATQDEAEDLLRPEWGLKAISWINESDFRGAVQESWSRVQCARRVLRDSVYSSVGQLEEVEPMKPSGVKCDVAIGQDEGQAREVLAGAGVEVRSVKRYRPKLNAEYISAIARVPVVLNPGDAVDLYVDGDRRVRYYARAEQGRSEAAPEEQEELKKMRGEVQKLRSESAAKDREIAELKAKVDRLNERQSKVLTSLTPARLARLERLLDE